MTLLLDTQSGEKELPATPLAPVGVGIHPAARPCGPCLRRQILSLSLPLAADTC